MIIRRLISLVVFALCVLSSAAPIAAQEDSGSALSDDEQALINRVTQLSANSADYISYVSYFASENSQYTVIDVPSIGLLQTTSRVISTISTREISLTEPSYGRATLLSNVLITEDDQAYGYELSGELRFADERLFINATSSDVIGNTDQFLPEEFNGVWQEVLDPGVLSDLGIGNFNSLFVDTQTNDDVLLGILTTATSVTTESVDTEDETLETITVAFDGMGFAAFLAQTYGGYDPEADPMTAALFQEIEAITDNVLELVIIVDAQERIIGRAVEANLNVTLDTGLFGVDTEGGTFTIEFGISQSEELSAINEPVRVVSIPEGYENPPEITAEAPIIGPQLPTATPSGN